MADINVEALAALAAALNALMPAHSPPASEPLLLINPLRVRPTGLGGYVGLNHDPEGDIIGRRVEAQVLVTVRGGDAQALNDSASAVIGGLVGAERVKLLERGILHIALAQINSKSVATGDGGADDVLERELSFAVLYEFLKKPEAAEGIIEQIDLDLDVG